MSTEMRQLIDAVAKARNGAEIRQPLINVFTTIFGKGRNAELFDNHNADYYALQADGVWMFDGDGHNAGDPRMGISSLLPFDNWTSKPKVNSQKLVTGETIISFTGDLEELPYEVEEIINYGR